MSVVPLLCDAILARDVKDTETFPSLYLDVSLHEFRAIGAEACLT
jgi:hypothetical protein